MSAEHTAQPDRCKARRSRERRPWAHAQSSIPRSAERGSPGLEQRSREQPPLRNGVILTGPSAKRRGIIEARDPKRSGGIRATAARLWRWGAALAALCGAFAGGKDVRAAQLTVRVEHRWQSTALVLGQSLPPSGSATPLSVTRLAYLLSAAKLQREDGSWIGAGNWSAFLDVEKGRTAFALSGVPAGKYRALRFDLGLDPATDRSDPAARPPGHPLHPEVNGLHWGWRGGYVFLAAEGRLASGGGFSYHLAGEACRGTIEVPAVLDISGGDLALTLVCDAARLFDSAHRVDLAATPATHSREGDTVAAQLADNAVRAFSLLRIEPDFSGAPPAAKNVLPARPGAVEIKLPPHFPQADWPADNLPTAAGVALGRRLFHDVRLSRNGSQSCASCHDPAFAFSDPRPVSIGADGHSGTRNSMPLFNLAWKPAFFWDGRAQRLRDQVLVPIQDAHEMNETLDCAVAKLDADGAVRAEFEQTFGTREITAERLSLALEQFLLTLISSDSRFEHALRGGVEFTAEEQSGFELFFTESDPARGIRGADCFHCHGGANFSNHGFFNNGLDADETRKDEGRSRATGREIDRGTFSVPSLRNIALTAPYMHDGRFTTLEQVIEHYDCGVKPCATLDPNLAKHFATGGLGLSAEEKHALVAFLKTLTGSEQRAK